MNGLEMTARDFNAFMVAYPAVSGVLFGCAFVAVIGIFLNLWAMYREVDRHEKWHHR